MSSKDISKEKRLKEELKKILNEVKTSERFMMLRLLRLSHFMQDGTFGSPHLDQLTLEDLVEQGAEPFFDNNEVESKTIKELIKILRNFLKENSSASSLELLDDAPPTLDDENNTDIQDDTVFEEQEIPLSKLEIRKKSSVEAEKILLKAYDDLRQAKCFEQIKNKKLSKYWDTSKVRDLFLEELSFKQLLSIKVEYLLEKHSFTKTKLEAIVDAIYKCLQVNGEESEIEEESGENSSIKENENNIDYKEGSTITWRNESVCDALISDAIISQFVLANYSVKKQNRWISKIITALPKLITAREYVIWWCEAAYGFELTSKLLNITCTDLFNEYKVCSEAIMAKLPDIASVFYTHWQGALSGAGASYSWLVNPYKIDLLSEDFQKVFFKGMLHSFGAVNVSAFGVSLENYWTTNPTLLEIILDGLIKEKKLTKKGKGQVLKKVLPLIPYEDLKPIIDVIKL